MIRVPYVVANGLAHCLVNFVAQVLPLLLTYNERMSGR